MPEPTLRSDAELYQTIRQEVTPVLPAECATPAPAGDLGVATRAGWRWTDTTLEFPAASRRPDPTAPTEPAPAAGRMPQIGDRFLGFELIRDLGRGSFARVYLARQPDLADRPVVLKISADTRAESRALAQLQHANIVPIYSVHHSGPLSALCMPYLGAATLADVYRDLEDLAREPESASQTPARRMIERLGYVEAILRLGAQLADGLAHAHERDVLHRDLKPANILLTDEGVPMLFDFNLAASTRNCDPAREGAGGTLPYMSPEQLEAFLGRPAVIDTRSDIFALGVILFELLTRTHPYVIYRPVVRETPARMQRDRLGPLPRLSSGTGTISPAVEAIVQKCLAPDPDDRYQCAADLKEDLDRQLRHLPLRHAMDPSIRERLWKWRRRNPTLASRTSFWILAAAATIALFLGYGRLGQELAREEPAASETRAR